MGLLDRHCDHVIMHTGQNYDYELNDIFFQDMSIRRPDVFLEAVGRTSAETIGNVIGKADTALRVHLPDAVLILGDTNSCMAAISAKRLKIPVFHMEAGNRCFDQRVPEEINRKIIDHCADMNLTYSDIARENLLSEGLHPNQIIKTGSPMFEVLSFYRERIAGSDILDRLDLNPYQYFVFSSHREENIDNERNFKKIVDILNGLATKFSLPIIVSTHPRMQKRIKESGITLNPLVQLMKPLGFSDYIALQSEAKAVLSDSGTITEESSILNFPALNIREAHERQEGMEEGAVMMVGLHFERIMQALAILSTQGRHDNRELRQVADYSMPNVSAKVLRIILSYTDYVNQVVWRK